MSMLSLKCDRLRQIADHLDGDPRTQHMAPKVMDAADTIWELRNRLAGTVDQSEEISRLNVENARLRKYARSYASVVSEQGCGLCPYAEDYDVCDTETEPMRDGCKLYDGLRELGIEVNE